MIFRLYKYSNNDKNIYGIEPQLNQKLLNKLNLFEKEIVKEYFKKQYGRKGIITLGNEIKYNEKIVNEVFVKEEEFALIKVTGNRKTFLIDFLKTITQNKNSKALFFLIYERHFRKESSIVDGTSTTIDDFEYNLGLLNNVFDNVNFNQDIYIIEINGIKNHYFKKHVEGYTKIFKSE